MAEALIHVLEMIHVDDKGRDHAVITLTVGDAVAQVIHQQRTVGDARQGIVRDRLHHLVEVMPGLGEIGNRTDQRDQLTCGAGKAHATLGNPARRAVRRQHTVFDVVTGIFCELILHVMPRHRQIVWRDD